MKYLREKNYNLIFTVVSYLFILSYSFVNEIIFSVSANLEFGIYKILFSLSIGAFLLFVGSVLKNRKVAFVIQAIFAVSLNFIYISQMIYFSIFGTPYYITSLMGIPKALEFASIALNSLGNYWITYLLMILQMVVLFAFYRKHFLKDKFEFRKTIISSVSFVVIAVISVLFPALFTDGLNSPRYLLVNEFVPLSTVNTFGVPACMAIDVKFSLFGSEEFEGKTEVTIVPVETEEELAIKPTDGADETPTPEPTPSATPKPIVYEEQVMDINFNLEESDPDYLSLNQFFSEREPTKENEYTGMFEGKNLILITAEAFSPYFIDSELTPTLYKMQNEGFVFENFYTPIWGVSTSDGEYVATTGLLPQSGVWSYTRAADNYMPFAFGNQFNSLGYKSFAFHNHSYTYYNRDKSYPTMGYDFYAKGHGLEITDRWPESDVEMIEQSTDMFIGEENFNVYYMTVSGHLEYNFGGNMMAYKNQEVVAHLPYSDAVKAYIACNLEFEYALAKLVEELEAAGKLDDTVFAISSDHYPYGLTNPQYSELRGTDYLEETFEIYENTFILWNSEMEEPITIDKYASSLDIAPTLSNLFGLEYDSRLYIGQDILSDSDPLVMFVDKSYITKDYMFNANTSEVTLFENSSITEEEVSEISSYVARLFSSSAMILEKDYYSYLFLNQG